MTDYLALALEQGDETEEETELDALERALRPVSLGIAAQSPTPQAREEMDEREPEEKELEKEEVAGLGLMGLSTPWRELERAQAAWEERGSISPGEDLAQVAPKQAGEAEEEVLRPSGGPAEGEVSLLASLQRVQRGVESLRRRSGYFSARVPEAPDAVKSWSVEEMDRTVERDARRYDGGFSLY